MSPQSNSCLSISYSTVDISYLTLIPPPLPLWEKKIFDYYLSPYDHMFFRKTLVKTISDYKEAFRSLIPCKKKGKKGVNNVWISLFSGDKFGNRPILSFLWIMLASTMNNVDINEHRICHNTNVTWSPKWATISYPLLACYSVFRTPCAIQNWQSPSKTLV